MQVVPLIYSILDKVELCMRTEVSDDGTGVDTDTIAIVGAQDVWNYVGIVNGKYRWETTINHSTNYGQKQRLLQFAQLTKRLQLQMNTLFQLIHIFILYHIT